MHNLLDWKYLLALLVALAAAAVPLWLWRADLASHSLHFRLAAQTAMQPDEKDALKGLTLSIDGVLLESPYLSVFELVNDGSKPIVVTDFESPIELRLGTGASVARARVTATMPKDLETELVTDKQSVKLKPLLLNPDDTVTIAVITSGKPPQFSPRARIAGVAAVPLEDATKPSISGAKKLFLIAAAFLLFVAYAISIEGAFSNAGVHLHRRTAALFALVTSMGATVSVITFLQTINEDRTWVMMLIVVGIALLGSIAAGPLNRRVAEEKLTLESKDAP